MFNPNNKLIKYINEKKVKIKSIITDIDGK